MKATLEAVFENGVLKPSTQLALSEGEHVRVTVESVDHAEAEPLLQLAAQVFEGLSDEDVKEIEDAARDRAFFAPQSHR